MCSTSINLTDFINANPKWKVKKKLNTICPISKVIQENGLLVSGANFGIAVRFPPFDLAINGLPYERLKPVHDDLYRFLCLVIEELE